MSAEVDAMTREEKLLFLASMNEKMVTDTNIILKAAIIAARATVENGFVVPTQKAVVTG